ncbi:hypothetical protein SG34_006050 [Thalassomonas viridans]|uniref:Uncharacterized protein n=1 Tax=Thalassomonas viridans TaxID=137584 RepID=A0AAF0CAM8_9GAMM|nr:hypothetical protein [Thalassomonas viridans]WDE06480.1 hypothetical protein SG34_006050 [Thalassomonas viridans]
MEDEDLKDILEIQKQKSEQGNRKEDMATWKYGVGLTSKKEIDDVRGEIQ